MLLVILCLWYSQGRVERAFGQGIDSSVTAGNLINVTYSNPIIYSDYSDPDVIRVGKDFYLTASSFNCVPGLPILHSNNLVHWEITGYALQRQYPLEIFDKPRHGNGVWAPSIRYRNGEYVIYYGDPDYGIYLVKSTSASGPWEQPLLIKSVRGWIDPCPFWDDDGNAYLIHAWAKSRSGFNSILTLHKMNRDGTRLLDDGMTIFDGHKRHPTIEGPKMYKRDGYYYIFAPAGGVKNGWQTVLRSHSIYGPYEDKVVMDQGTGSVNGPHQGAWVELASGESWFLHFQDRGAYGRITHLQPMKWINDWPMIGKDADGDGKGEPVLEHALPGIGEKYPPCFLQASDEFTTESIGLQWQWQANPESVWMERRNDRGRLRLFCVPLPDSCKNLWDVPNLLLQKFPSQSFTITTKMICNFRSEREKTGLIIMGTDYSYLSVRREKGRLAVSQATCLDADKGGIETDFEDSILTNETIYLRMTVTNNAQCRFSYSVDGISFLSMGVPFTAKPGKWIGAKIGLFCITMDQPAKPGYADIDWFRVERDTDTTGYRR